MIRRKPETLVEVDQREGDAHAWLLALKRTLTTPQASVTFGQMSQVAPTPPQNRTSAINQGAADAASTSKPNRRITDPSLRAKAS